MKVSPRAVESIHLINSTKALRTVPGYRKHWGSCSCYGLFLYVPPEYPLVSGPVGEAVCMGHPGHSEGTGPGSCREQGGVGAELVPAPAQPPGLL